MGNKLFQKAREFVEEALHSEHDGDQQKTEEIAKNALSSAFANTNDAEKEQLRELQEELENHPK
ncbi:MULTISPECIES: DUF3813 domain-containing protein [Peribacillus]|uniref:DUF3813 domain-containing protein n=1 Tax=Peribacillus TaxID=2675229 RepID=UPI00191444DB|nr:MULTISPECIES: DUF3813 domain-containing protein [Peribacillus]MBK5445496.1 DUF3813 domain-containing protein [Peribacillus sp. TH24]MBK5459782.1 DUF3813 domain-containing protein [Peribacillus sp. TH27]MBK5481591.1 DUF3813 domain-containing protein [Peribacillus sp. TH16]MBK5497972.1 DUF3813 domain-containing protein [Peribacillus sp. TH14]MED3689103.1 DUF3813 domain-containing protein [Peribacillus butanolivorans]